jgi:hypothetical protein
LAKKSTKKLARGLIPKEPPALSSGRHKVKSFRRVKMKLSHYSVLMLVKAYLSKAIEI